MCGKQNGQQKTNDNRNVEDMKVSHHNHQEISILIEWSKQKYEVEGLKELKSTRGKLHILGMTL